MTITVKMLFHHLIGYSIMRTIIYWVLVLFMLTHCHAVMAYWDT